MPGINPFEYLKVGSSYRRSKLHDLFGGNRQGGISPSRSYPIIFLFSSDRGEEFGYRDGWESDGLFHYCGEGQTGDMEFKRGNKAIRDHASEGKALLLFEGSGTERIYRGPMDYVDHEIVELSDREGSTRKGIIFKLVKTDIEHEPCLSPDVSHGNVSYVDLLPAARDASRQSPPQMTRETKTTYYERSRQVREYVLARTRGYCEGCGYYAPFVNRRGNPYLEAHHTTRLSDEGPDDLSTVIGLCPTCHKRVHHAKDGDDYNQQLKVKVKWIQEQVNQNRLKDVSALILISDGRVLVTKRNEKGSLANKWEFPGGKIEQGETTTACIKREIKEELTIKLEDATPSFQITHEYPTFTIRLFCHTATSYSGNIHLKEHQEKQWVDPKNVGSLDLAEADQKVLSMLIKMSFSLVEE